MRLYNTATATTEEKTWGPTVTIYTCGITPYDSAHIGHVFTFLTYDLLQRYLEFRGHTVRLVRNITDVDEPIYRRAAELGMPYTKLAEDEVTLFQDVMHKLGLKQPYAEPRASKYIPEMAAAVEKLLLSKHAYRLENGDVYFDVSTMPAFGSVSQFNRRLQLAFMAERGGDPERPDKRQALDFLLWKAVHDPKDLAQWKTSVGTGRPGWHIECSVMSEKLLGTPMDIHGGGMDLIFPHHECENAQSAALGHKPFARHWMHVAPISHVGEKMSKSLGNLVFVKDLLETYHPAVIRLALMQYHYRIGGEWHSDALTEAKALWDKLNRALLAKKGPDPRTFMEQMYQAYERDLLAPEILCVLERFAGAMLQGSSHKQAPAALRDMMLLAGIEA